MGAVEDRQPDRTGVAAEEHGPPAIGLVDFLGGEGVGQPGLRGDELDVVGGECPGGMAVDGGERVESAEGVAGVGRKFTARVSVAVQPLPPVTVMK